MNQMNQVFYDNILECYIYLTYKMNIHFRKDSQQSSIKITLYFLHKSIISFIFGTSPENRNQNKTTRGNCFK